MSDYSDETPMKPCEAALAKLPHVAHRSFERGAGATQCDGVPFPDVTINGADLRRLFDLAVDTPLLCSGSFESEDVDLLRKLGALIGADLEAITPSEYIAQYPHRFVPRPPFRAEIMPVVERESGPLGYRARRVRDETSEEYAARRAESEADACDAGTYGRRCQRPKADPMHIDAAVSS